MFLQTNGVWVRKHRNATVPESLFNTLQKEDPTEWTELKIKEYMATKGEFNSGRIKYLLKNNFTSISTSTSTTETPISISPATNPTLLTTPPTQPISSAQQSQPPINQSTTTGPSEQNQNQGFGKELTNLAKIYTEDNKYSGEDDNFDFKLTIFHDLCNRADVPQEAKAKAYPTMLCGLA